MGIISWQDQIPSKPGFLFSHVATCSPPFCLASSLLWELVPPLFHASSSLDPAGPNSTGSSGCSMPLCQTKSSMPNMLAPSSFLISGQTSNLCRYTANLGVDKQIWGKYLRLHCNSLNLARHCSYDGDYYIFKWKSFSIIFVSSLGFHFPLDEKKMWVDMVPDKLLS